MLKLSWIEFFLRAIPENIIFIFAMYLFSNTKIKWKNILLYAILLAVSIQAIRLLPIKYGINTILFACAYIFIAIKLIKVETFKAISYGLINIILLIASEFIDMMIIGPPLFGSTFPSQDQFANLKPIEKVVYGGIPTLLVFLLFVLAVYYIKKQFKRKA